MSKKDSPICESCGGELDEERVCCNLLCEMYYPPNNKPQPQTNTPIEAIEFAEIDKWFIQLYENAKAMEQAKIQANLMALEAAFNNLKEIFKTQKRNDRAI